MLIYVDHVTERLQYTFHFVFTEHGLPLEITNDKSFFEQAAGRKLAYTDWEFTGISTILPSPILFEEAIIPQLRLDKVTWGTTEMLTIDSVIDPFAAIFYVLSRYEEYLPGRRDVHDRVEAKSSVLFRFGWLRQQIIERWIHVFVERYCPEYLGHLHREVTVIPSFDIDHVYAYKLKDGWRKWLAVLKDRAKGNEERLAERSAVLSGTIPDPYDSYQQITAIAKRFPQTRIFWQLGDLGEFDRNVSWLDPRHQRLIRNMDQVAHVGLHPSYASNLSDKRLSEEQERLQVILGRRVTESRQHFLKLRFPATYRRLDAREFRRDYTLGYADQPGFRSGTAHPHFFFDLEKNRITHLQLVPFVYMDGTLREYMELSIPESKNLVTQLADEVRAYGGVFCCIWHNETIGFGKNWSGWSEVLDHTLDYWKDATVE